MVTQPPRTIHFADIARRFKIAPLTLGTGSFFPGVVRNDDRPDRYSIRVAVGHTRRGHEVTEKYDYFRCDAEGTITEAPRGYAKDYRPGRIPVEELDEAVQRYAAVTR